MKARCEAPPTWVQRRCCLGMSRHNLPKGTRFHIEHENGADEPLLWAADIVAGAVRVHRQQGDSICRDLLADCLYEIEVDARC